MDKCKEAMTLKFKNKNCIDFLDSLRYQKDLKKIQCTRNGCRKTYPVYTHPLLYN